MKWKDVKFWCWIEVRFPPQVNNLEDSSDDLSANAQLFDDNFGAVEDGTCAPDTTGSPVYFEIFSFTSEFEVNSIPTGRVNVAIGRRADDVTKAATAHFYVNDMKLQLPAIVWCQAKSVQSSDGSAAVSNEWPADKFKIFDGYITGSGFRRNAQGAELSFGLTHWLTDLNFSSAVSKQSHPLNAAQFYYPAVMGVTGQEAGGSPNMVTRRLAEPFFQTSTIVEDFWGGSATDNLPKGLKRWLLEVTSFDRINADQINHLAQGNANTLRASKNWEACRALTRFEPNAELDAGNEVGYKLGVPLSMADQGELNGNIAESIAGEIGIESLEGYSNVTLWDKLAGDFHANYMYSVIPLIDKALVVPLVAGLSSGDDLTMVHRVLQTSDYESIDVQAILSRPLRAVGVTLDYGNQAGGISKEHAAQYAGFGGYFDKMVPLDDPDLNPTGLASTPDARYDQGLIMFTTGPRWMSGLVLNYQYTDDSTGNGGNIATAVSPNAGQAPTASTPRDVLKSARTIWNLYARSLFIAEVLKKRQGLISGPVRFDIAPGSCLKVEATEDKYIKHIIYAPLQNLPECDQDYNKYFWCSVLRVSTTIDCQNMRAFTNYYVSYIRDRTENKDVGTAIARHPVWQKCRWAGCVMIEDAAFEPLTTQDCEDED